MKKILAVLVFMLFLGGAAYSQEAKKKDEKKQFVIVLKLVPRLLDEKNWTDKENQAVGRHFKRLQQLTKDGKVILAGRTTNDADASQFGVIIVEVASEEEARKIMDEDDAVKEKLMTAQLFPFTVALMKQ